ncbi:MAG: hypothetical protein RMI89_01565 [Gloeomargarita sp. SKYBB_i_bin120]|nr:hypothetical protein [Gloeomargarita sp. SKYG98]MCS7291650.1 hypothetical protein [Gloeomargarita sp. SKYB120]MDW8177209.1 hypothetical protein [Gloeomargarita sp. SKYBB_i_bin120]
MTTALAVLGGPLGMISGIGILGLLGLITKGLADYGFERLSQSTVEALRKQGKSKEEIAREIDSYPISYKLKLKIKDYLQQL